MTMRLSVSIETITGSTYRSGSEQVTDEDLQQFKDHVKDIKDFDNFTLVDESGATVIFNPEHIVTITLEVAQEDPR